MQAASLGHLLELPALVDMINKVEDAATTPTGAALLSPAKEFASRM